MYLKGVRKQKNSSKFSYRIHLKLPTGKIVNIEKGSFDTANQALSARKEKIIELTTQNCENLNIAFEQVFNEYLSCSCADKPALQKKYITYYNSYLKEPLGTLYIGETLGPLKALQKKLCKSAVPDHRGTTKQIYISQAYLQGLKALLFNIYDFAYVKRYIQQHPMYCLDEWNIYRKKENTYIEPLFAYLGNKHKILPDLIDLFPDHICTFVDLFGGSAVVGINVNANSIIVNENNLFLIGIYSGLQKTEPAIAWELIESIIEKYNLNTENEDGFYQCRTEYNAIDYSVRCEKYWYWGLALVYCSFNRSTVQFNAKGEYNAPFGYDKLNFVLSKRKFMCFAEKVFNSNIIFSCNDYRNIIIPKDAFVYVDPPYLITTATYNRSWNLEHENALYAFLEKLDTDGIKWAFSNVFENNGIVNYSLKNWLSAVGKKYKIYYLKTEYNHANFRRKNLGRTIEVLITNY